MKFVYSNTNKIHRKPAKNEVMKISSTAGAIEWKILQFANIRRIFMVSSLYYVFYVALVNVRLL